VWKLVIVESGGNLHAAAFLAPQTETKAARLFEHQVTISELESATGLQFLPEFGALPQDFKSEVDPLFFRIE
jgi:DNA/RNA endonuclease G (NUC1)